MSFDVSESLNDSNIVNNKFKHVWAFYPTFMISSREPRLRLAPGKCKWNAREIK